MTGGAGPALFQKPPPPVTQKYFCDKGLAHFCEHAYFCVTGAFRATTRRLTDCL
jgi:hypothetical protein